MSSGGVEQKSREIFVDAARGVSIILVVLWHASDERLLINGPLVFLRMPLFFFVSGLFAGGLLKAPIRKVLTDRVGQLLWIFVIWSTLIYLSTILVKQIINDVVDPYPLYAIFWEPQAQMWFVYALALSYLLLRLTTFVPRSVLLVLGLAVYCYAVATDEWANPTFANRLARLLPLLMFSVFYAKEIIAWSKRNARFFPVLLGLFAPSAYVVYHSSLSTVGPVTIVVSALGIFGTLCACSHYAESRVAAALAWIGEKSVFIYVMHFTILIYLRNAAEIVGLPQHPGVDLAMAAAAIAISLGAGIWIVDPYFPFLLKAPWLQARRKPAAVKDPAPNPSPQGGGA